MGLILYGDVSYIILWWVLFGMVMHPILCGYASYIMSWCVLVSEVSYVVWWHALYHVVICFMLCGDTSYLVCWCIIYIVWCVRWHVVMCHMTCDDVSYDTCWCVIWHVVMLVMSCSYVFWCSDIPYSVWSYILSSSVYWSSIMVLRL
jgi:hypothetical protein